MIELETSDLDFVAHLLLSGSEDDGARWVYLCLSCDSSKLSKKFWSTQLQQLLQKPLAIYSLPDTAVLEADG